MLVHDSSFGEPASVCLSLRNLSTFGENLNRGAGNRSSILSICGKHEHLSGCGLGDDHHLADHHYGIGAQFAVGRLNQINTLVRDGDRNLLGFPTIFGAGEVLSPGCYKLIAVDDWDLRERIHPLPTVFCRKLRGLSSPGTNHLAVLGGELSPEEIANSGKDAVLPVVKALQQ